MLPPGWEIRWSKTTGQLYFQNKEMWVSTYSKFQMVLWDQQKFKLLETYMPLDPETPQTACANMTPMALATQSDSDPILSCSF